MGMKGKPYTKQMFLLMFPRSGPNTISWCRTVPCGKYTSTYADVFFASFFIPMPKFKVRKDTDYYQHMYMCVDSAGVSSNVAVLCI